MVSSVKFLLAVRKHFLFPLLFLWDAECGARGLWWWSPLDCESSGTYSAGFFHVFGGGFVSVASCVISRIKKLFQQSLGICLGNNCWLCEKSHPKSHLYFMDRK